MELDKNKIPWTIEIPWSSANDFTWNWVSRLKEYVPDAMNWILMEKWEVRYNHPFSLPELIEDLESYTITFQRYLADTTTFFSDQIDNQVVRDMWLYYNWKSNNQFSLNNKKLSHLININEELISQVWAKLIQKLWIEWNGEWDTWEMITDELERRNFA